MAFLSSVAGYVITAILSALGGWLLKMLHTWQQDRQTQKQAEESVQPLKDADPNDGKAIDDATDKALGGF